MNEPAQKRTSPILAGAGKRARQLAGPFATGIHALQIRAAFTLERLGSSDHRPDSVEAAKAELAQLTADFTELSLAFDEATLADAANSRVVEMRRTLDRIGDQLRRMRDDPVVVDPFSFVPYPASPVRRAG